MVLGLWTQLAFVSSLRSSHEEDLLLSRFYLERGSLVWSMKAVCKQRIKLQRAEEQSLGLYCLVPSQLWHLQTVSANPRREG